MIPNASRRRFLTLSSGTSVLVLSGCLSTDGLGWGESTPEPRTDDLYVNNKDGYEYRVSIRLARINGDSEGDETVLDNDYRLPSLDRFRIPDVGDEGATYEVGVEVDGEEFTNTWDVRTCKGTNAPKGNRDAEVRINDGEVELVENVCDAIWVERRPSSDHEEYLVEETETGTTTDG